MLEYLPSQPAKHFSSHRLQSSCPAGKAVTKGGRQRKQTKDEKQEQLEAKHMHDYIYTKGLRKAGT